MMGIIEGLRREFPDHEGVLAVCTFAAVILDGAKAILDYMGDDTRLNAVPLRKLSGGLEDEQC